jgi:hypothetical protein
MIGRRLLALALVGISGCSTGANELTPRAEDAVRAAETERLRALVAADMETAERLHAPNFRVINPLGRALSREAYLRSVATGESDYTSWEPGTIEVRLHGRQAVVTYQSRVEITVRGQRLPPMRAWNTGIYELRNRRWAIVWFQVTEVAPARR